MIEVEKMARPTTPKEPGEQTTVSIRMDGELKTRLEERATANTRNLSQECSRALERSFSAADLFEDSLNLLQQKGLLQPMAAGGFAEYAMRRICGDEVGALAAWFGQNLALVRMMKHISGTGIVTEVAIRKPTLDRLKAAVRELEREGNVITTEGK
jgi:hypothetical protein